MVISDFFHLTLGRRGVYSVCSCLSHRSICLLGGGGGQQASSLSSEHKLWNFHRYLLVFYYCWAESLLLAQISMASNFARPEVHLTEIQALSNHKKEYGGWLKEFFQELVCFVGKMAARTHF